MDKTQDMSRITAHAKNPLNYVLIALGILLLVMGLPVLFATSEVSRLIGDALGQGVMLGIIGVLVAISGASMIAVGLRRQ